MTQRNHPNIPFTWVFLLPQYWGIWLGFLLFIPCAYLPWVLQKALGIGLGNIIWYVGKRRRRDTLINIALCFPNKTPAQQRTLAQHVFQQAGMGIFESLSAWFWPSRFHASQVEIEGLQHIVNATAQGNSVIVLGAHYTLLDLGGLLCSRYFKADIVYRPQNNLLLEWLFYHIRKAIFPLQIPHKNMRLLVKSLRNKHIIWYTPDQDFGLEQGVMAPFYNIPAATITAQRRLANIDNSTVVAIHFYRKPNNHWWSTAQYHISITPPLENYPSDNEIADATRINALLETLINRAPEQYMWFHRRFKSRPAAMDNIY